MRIFIPVWCIINMIVCIYKLYYFILGDGRFQCNSLPNWTLIITFFGNIGRIVYVSTLQVVRFSKVASGVLTPISGIGIMATIPAIFFWINIGDFNGRPLYRYRYIMVLFIIIIMVTEVAVARTGGPTMQIWFLCTAEYFLAILSLIIGWNRIPRIYENYVGNRNSKLRKVSIWMSLNGIIVLFSGTLTLVGGLNLLIDPYEFTILVFVVMVAFNMESACQLVLFHPTAVRTTSISLSPSYNPNSGENTITNGSRSTISI